MEFKATVEHAPDAVRLDDWPLLTYAPRVHGPFVATEDHGIPVADIAAAARGMDPVDLAALAARFSTTTGHVRQALDYVSRNPEGPRPAAAGARPGGGTT